MFEKFNGTPLWVIKLLTMQRVEYQVDGPLTQLARDAVGLGDVSQLAPRMDEETADYPSIRLRPAYVALQDVEKHTRPDAGRLAAGRKSRRQVGGEPRNQPAANRARFAAGRIGQERPPFLAAAPYA